MAYQEGDDGFEGQLSCTPHIVVESSTDKFHRYILTDSINLDEFRAVEEALIRDYGSDPNAKDISRMLRLPGFYHQKVNSEKGQTGVPFKVKLVSVSDDAPLPWDEVKRLFPARLNNTGDSNKPTPSNVLPFNKVNLHEIWDALQVLDPDMGRDDWLHIGMALHSVADPECFKIWDKWSQGHRKAENAKKMKKAKKYNAGDCDRAWRSFNVTDGGITIASLFKMARDAGWQPRKTADEMFPGLDDDIVIDGEPGSNMSTAHVDNFSMSELAKAFISAIYPPATTTYYQGEYHRFNGCGYKPTSAETVHHKAWGFLPRCYMVVKGGRIPLQENKYKRRSQRA